jgi:hypothetical protein
MASVREQTGQHDRLVHVRHSHPIEDEVREVTVGHGVTVSDLFAVAKEFGGLLAWSGLVPRPAEE